MEASRELPSLQPTYEDYDGYTYVNPLSVPEVRHTANNQKGGEQS